MRLNVKRADKLAINYIIRLCQCQMKVEKAGSRQPSAVSKYSTRRGSRTMKMSRLADEN